MSEILSPPFRACPNFLPPFAGCPTFSSHPLPLDGCSPSNPRTIEAGESVGTEICMKEKLYMMQNFWLIHEKNCQNIFVLTIFDSIKSSAAAFD